MTLSEINQEKKKVLFLCTHNSARSQMAEGLLRAMYRDRYEAYSAGVEATSVDPRAVRAMLEIGIDISAQRSKLSQEFQDVIFDVAVTVCDRAKQACPICSTQLNLPSKSPKASEVKHKSFESSYRFRQQVLLGGSINKVSLFRIHLEFPLR